MLPAWLQDESYLSLDTWLALEFEEMGFPIVLLYDLVDGAVALRGSMVRRFEELVTSQPDPRGNHARRDDAGEDAGQASQRTESPQSEGESADRNRASSGDDQAATPDEDDGWMVACRTTVEKPEDFLGMLHKRVFPRHDVPVAVVSAPGLKNGL